MATYSQTFAHIGLAKAAAYRQKRATHAAHRKAFGPGKHRTPEQRAQDVAASIAQRQDEGRAWDWACYGLDADGDWAQRNLVDAALARLYWTREDLEKLAAHHYEEEQARLEELEMGGELD